MTRVPDVDAARVSMIIYGDTITVAGNINNPPLNTKFRMTHFDLDGQKLGQTIDIDHPEEKFTRMFQQNGVRFQNRNLVIGRGIQNDTMQGLIYVMNNEDELDSLIRLEPQEDRSVIWDASVTDDGYIYTYHEIDEGVLNKERKIINKFDKDFNQIRRYQNEDTFKWDSGSFGDVLDDGRILLVTYSPLTISPHSSIRAIKQDGFIDWQYNVPFNAFVDDGVQEEVNRVVQLQSGDILCMGRYTNLMLDGAIRDSPFMYKINTEGEVIWKRVFYEIDPSTEKSRVGSVRDAVEIDNGDILGIGWMDYDGQRETFIFKLDSDGCLDTDDCDFVQLIAAAEDVEIRNDIKVFPNPVSDILTIYIDQLPEKVEIYTTDGVIIKTESKVKEIDVSGLLSGLYYMKVYVGESIGVVPFVK